MKTAKTASAVPWVLSLDAGVVVTNLFLFDLLSREMGALVRSAWFDEDARAGRLLGCALLATFVAQMVGAVLKRGPLRARLGARRAYAGQGDPSNKKWVRLRVKHAATRYQTFFHVLLFLHFALSSLTAFTIPVLLGEAEFEWMYGLSIPFMFIPTILVAYALVPPQPDAPPPAGWRAHPLTETFANLGLFSYALINQLFWAGWLPPNTPLAGAGEIPVRALQAFLFLVPVTLMYFFSTRILFLAEELDDPRTRLSMKLAVASIALRWIVGAEDGRGW